MPGERKILVTGASGFVGGRVVEALSLSGFGQPRAMVRSWSRAARVARFPVEIVTCDILDEKQVAHAVEGVDAVVHCAYDNSREGIVQGTATLLEAARREGVERFVYLSTAEVYGREARGDIDESAERPRNGDLYADSKNEAEELCLQCDANGLPTTILRPSIIYGPYSAAWTINIAACLNSGRWGIFDDCADGFCNLVYVDDLVRAIFAAIDCSDAAGQAFNVNGPDRVTWNQYFERFNSALGRPDLQKVSATSARLRSRAMDGARQAKDFVVSRFKDRLMKTYLRDGFAGRMMKRVKNVLNTTPSATQIEALYSRRARYVDDKARRVLGYEPHISLDQGLKQSVQWLAHHGFIQSSVDSERGIQSRQVESQPAVGHV